MGRIRSSRILAFPPSRVGEREHALRGRRSSEMPLLHQGGRGVTPDNEDNWEKRLEWNGANQVLWWQVMIYSSFPCGGDEEEGARLHCWVKAQNGFGG
jgi:hypothetical protein